MFLLSPHSDLADPVHPKPKVPNGTATTPQNPNPSALKDSVVDTATNCKLDPTSEEIAALKKKKEQEDMLKIGKNPKEFSKLKRLFPLSYMPEQVYCLSAGLILDVFE
jgi:hypothetical protein